MGAATATLESWRCKLAHENDVRMMMRKKNANERRRRKEAQKEKEAKKKEKEESKKSKRQNVVERPGVKEIILFYLNAAHLQNKYLFSSYLSVSNYYYLFSNVRR